MDRFLLACIFSVLFLSIPSLHADPLDDILKDQALNLGRSGQGDVKLPDWVDPESDYAKIFNDDEARKRIFEWLGDPPEGFHATKGRMVKEKEFIRGTMSFTGPHSVKISLLVMIPNPTLESMVKYGLIREFARLEPPALDSTSSEKFDIRGFQAELFHLEGNGCTILVKLSRGAVVNLKEDLCSDMKALPKLAEGLDLKRLDAKLNS